MLAILTDTIAAYSRYLLGFVLYGKPPVLSAAELSHCLQLLSKIEHEKRATDVRRSEPMLCKSGGGYLINEKRFFEKVGAIFLNMR